MDIQTLVRPGPPTALVTSAEWREIVKAQIALESESPDTAWVHLRGAKMRSADGFFDEIAAALQLPIWFGENWDALIDVLRDRAWLAGTVVAVYDAEQLLVDASDRDRTNLADILEQCAAHARDDGEGFHVLCQVPAAAVADFTARWRNAKLTVGTI